jgi:precorrin-2 dehydrogenase/sirohydrochlorin ferrochelatase
MERNELYPIFLKLNNLNVLIVGGGNVGLEKIDIHAKIQP